jgi:hypothetical protein
VDIYLDDIIIFSPSIEQHLIDISKVFEILRENNLIMNIVCDKVKIKIISKR